MNYQTIFETGARHLFAQGKRSTLDPSGVMCAYRGKEGLKCIAGIFINDDKYNSDMERLCASKIFEKFGNIGPAFNKRNIELLDNLQEVHDDRDNWVTSREMRAALKRFAISYKLRHKFLDELKFADR